MVKYGRKACFYRETGHDASGCAREHTNGVKCLHRRQFCGAPEPGSGRHPGFHRVWRVRLRHHTAARALHDQLDTAGTNEVRGPSVPMLFNVIPAARHTSSVRRCERFEPVDRVLATKMLLGQTRVVKDTVTNHVMLYRMRWP